MCIELQISLLRRLCRHHQPKLAGVGPYLIEAVFFNKASLSPIADSLTMGMTMLGLGSPSDRAAAAEPETLEILDVVRQKAQEHAEWLQFVSEQVLLFLSP